MNIVEQKQLEINDLCQKNNIGFLGLFGSMARGENTEKSDVDLLVRFNKQIGLFTLIDVENQFSELLHKKVDLVTTEAVHPYIKEYVTRDLKSIYGQA